MTVHSQIKTTGVIGAGQMGNGIAHVFACAGFNVVMQDISDAAVQNGLSVIEKNITRQVARGDMSEDDAQAALARITPATTITALAEVDFVIEAATEDLDLKIKILNDLSRILKPDAIIASNTSSISITKLAAATDRPDKMIGMHFFNPVPMMKLVEIIKGITTDEATFTITQKLVDALGKTATIAEDFPGFVVNRILIPMINEAVYTLYEGVGTVEAIDTGLKLGANHPMGPLQLADLIGLDTCLSVCQVLHDGFGDDKYRPCPLLIKYVEAGWLGRKTGRGFYDYSGDAPVPTR